MNRKPERRKGTPRAWVARQVRLPLILASVFCSMAHADSGSSAPVVKDVNSRKLGLKIKVEDGGWGAVRRDNIETVLYAVADKLLARLPQKLSAPILVSHTDSNPIALYDRGPAGEYLVRLHAKGENWHLYVYEFAHELCHILSNYEENVGADTTKYNQWFEETLCETASLYTLKGLATAWETSPPDPKWAAEAKHLRRFFEHLLAEGHRQLPPHAPLAAWLREHEPQLRKDPYLREKNDVVAKLLLPLFADNPQNWDALGYLNLDPADARASLDDYLQHWYRNAPVEHKHFIANVLAMLSTEGSAVVARLLSVRDSSTLTAISPSQQSDAVTR